MEVKEITEEILHNIKREFGDPASEYDEALKQSGDIDMLVDSVDSLEEAFRMYISEWRVAIIQKGAQNEG